MSEQSKPPLQYQVAPSPATRGQFRLLLLLMLIQVVITAQSAYAPGFVTWVKQRWAEHQQAVAHRAQVRQNEAIAGRCLSYTQPATKVVWEEDPDRAAKLLAGTGYWPLRPQSSRVFIDVLNAFPSIAMAGTPIHIPMDDPTYVPSEFHFVVSPIGGMAPNSVIAFLHGRKAGDAERLVLVVFTGSVSDPKFGGGSGDGNLWVYFLKSQSFKAASFSAGKEGNFPASDFAVTELSLAAPNDPSGGTGNVTSEATEMPAKWSPPTAAGQPGKLTIAYRSQMRVYAGQPDPTDASHFTMSYDLDGQPGVIDGWLKADGSVVLEPRVGKRVNTIWYPKSK